MAKGITPKMTKTIETRIINGYRDLYNIPALDMFNQNDDKLDKLHTEVELLGGYIAGFIGTYIKTKKINWTKQELQKRIEVLEQKIKNINSGKVKEKKLFNQYRKYAIFLIKLMKLMIEVKRSYRFKK